MPTDIIMLIIVAAFGFALGMQVSDRIWMARITRVTQRMERIGQEIVELKSMVQAKIVTVETMPDGLMLMYTNDGTFLAQGTDHQSLVESLRDRVGPGKVYLSDIGVFET